MTLSPRRPAFTLIELLVVIAIIALLVSILLPALGAARKEAQATKTASNIRNVGIATFTYNASFRGLMPQSYFYGADTTTNRWNAVDQVISGDDEKGYVHWSVLLFDDGTRTSEAFQSPAVPRGGAPATNPGPNFQNWEAGQVNGMRGTSPSEPPYDRQAGRVAFSANGAIIGRGKVAPLSVTGKQRGNRFVADAEIGRASSTILACEFASYGGNWRAIFDDAQKSKSHRPIVPFTGQSSSSPDSVWEETRGTSNIPRFLYPELSEILTNEVIGSDPSNLITGVGLHPLNAVGRQQPGSKGPYGGSSHFVFVDGHVDRQNVVDTLKKRLWGDKFYAITGPGNGISNLTPIP